MGKHWWVKQRITQRPSAARLIKEITLFGEQYEMRDHCRNDQRYLYEYWIVPINYYPGESFCIHFSSTNAAHASSFRKGLEDCQYLSLIQDTVLEPAEGESYWRYMRSDNGTEEYCGPYGSVYQTEKVSGRLRVVINEAGTPEDVVFEYVKEHIITIPDPNDGRADEDASADSMPILRLDWEIMSSEAMTKTTTAARQKSADPKSQEELYIAERLETIWRLRPVRWWAGKTMGAGKLEYYIAEFPDWVIAESPWWGNALYAYPNKPGGMSWKEVFRYSRQTIREELGGIRIIHNEGWEEELRKLIATKL